MTSNKQQDCQFRLPCTVWPVHEITRLETSAADSLGLTLFELMRRAGGKAFEFIRHRWPEARRWVILCGNGNNGGDGYIVALLAQAEGFHVTLLACDEHKNLPQEAKAARENWLAAGGLIHAADVCWPEQTDIIVDALFGTGLNRPVQAPYDRLILRANQHPAPIFAIDIPSGLQADTGAANGAVINAEATLAFIALKPGLLTGKARAYVGKLHFHALGLDSWLAMQKTSMARYDANSLCRWLKPRLATSHKGNHGRLLLIGGDHGMAGAIRLAGEAALRSGAGLVRVLTHSENRGPLLAARPELMVQALSRQSVEESLQWADVVVIGPGLGMGEWGDNALQLLRECKKPMLWDADALNLLAIEQNKRQLRIITPHPGEAARLLDVTTADIESDRLHAARCLVKRYGGVAVLKGAGTIVACEKGEMAFTDVGNPGMATGGMGDILSGIIGALVGQKLSLYDAACAGCVVHGAAADARAASYGTRGMLATDILNELAPFVNPVIFYS